jgi:hypothetical protein
VAAILTLIALIFGNLLAGLAAIGFWIASAIAEDDVDWPLLRCNVFWLRWMVVEAEKGLRDKFVLGGLAYPPSSKLSKTPPDGPTEPAVDGTDIPDTEEGWPLTRTRSYADYPRRMDSSNGPPDLNWWSFPESSLEEPSTSHGVPSSVYADEVIRGMGLEGGGMLTDNGEFPTRGARFGGAVANAVDLIRKLADGLVDYNLDGDRGYGWKTWRPSAGTQPQNPPVQAEPES